MTTLVVTNDFPPRVGGIENFASSLVTRLAGDVVVLTRQAPGAGAGDAASPVPVVRIPGSPLLPGPRVARRVAEVVRSHGVSSVWFPSSVPLGLLAPVARRAGAEVVVASTHGHETWWAATPGARSALRSVARAVDALTYVTAFTRGRIAAALPPETRSRLVPLAPGVDGDLFRPDSAARVRLRAGLGIGDGPLVLAVSRLVRRKGHDRLLAAWPRVRRHHPGAVLAVVGDGPERHRVGRLARAAGGRGGGVLLAGAVPWHATPAWYAAADVFALPVRTRLGGLEPEALGMCFLEAGSSGVPVVAGRSGGVPEVVADGVTGSLVDGRDPDGIAAAISGLLADPEARSRAGDQGRRSALQWSWEASAHQLERLLAAGSGPG